MHTALVTFAVAAAIFAAPSSFAEQTRASSAFSRPAPQTVPAAPASQSASVTAVATAAPEFVTAAEAFVAAYNSKTPIPFAPPTTDAKRAAIATGEAMLRQVRDRLGPIVGIDRIEAETPYKGRVHVNMESRQASFQMEVESAPPHRIRALQIGGGR